MPWDIKLDSVTGNDLGTTQTTGNNVDEVQRSGSPRPRTPTATRRCSGTRARRATTSPGVDERLVQLGLRPGPRQRPGEQPGRNDIEAAIVNLFGMHNIMHDYAYYLGFDEPHWNSQQYNNNAGGLANDGLLGNRRRLRQRRRTAKRAATTRT